MNQNDFVKISFSSFMGKVACGERAILKLNLLELLAETATMRGPIIIHTLESKGDLNRTIDQLQITS